MSESLTNLVGKMLAEVKAIQPKSKGTSRHSSPPVISSQDKIELPAVVWSPTGIFLFLEEVRCTNCGTKHLTPMGLFLQQYSSRAHCCNYQAITPEIAKTYRDLVIRVKVAENSAVDCCSTCLPTLFPEVKV